MAFIVYIHIQDQYLFLYFAYQIQDQYLFVYFEYQIQDQYLFLYSIFCISDASETIENLREYCPERNQHWLDGYVIQTALTVIVFYMISSFIDCIDLIMLMISWLIHTSNQSITYNFKWLMIAVQNICFEFLCVIMEWP